MVMDANLTADNILIADIAQGLSQTRRWAGQGSEFYSVAQHSVLLHMVMTRDFPDQPLWALWALLHDASEAYIGDVPRPFEQLMPDYMGLEAILMDSVAEKFDLVPDIPFEVKRADHNILKDEADALFSHLPNTEWLNAGDYKGVNVRVIPWGWREARSSWLTCMKNSLTACGKRAIWLNEFGEKGTEDGKSTDNY
jgi:hypothetical protein